MKTNKNVAVDCKSTPFKKMPTLTITVTLKYFVKHERPTITFLFYPKCD